MNKIIELFGQVTDAKNIDWKKLITEQECPFLAKRCYKVRKSHPETSIGTCTVCHGKKAVPTIICPARFIQRKQIFTDCLHLLNSHVPGNEIHLLSEVNLPGGFIDYVLVSSRAGKICDFVGIELQSLDTVGTVWPERLRLLREFGVDVEYNVNDLKDSFGMNWKMTAKTILMQMHHKIKSFEYLNRKLVLVIQDSFATYMNLHFNFDHVNKHAVAGDSMHFHVYNLRRENDGEYRLSLLSRLSTDAKGISKCLGLKAEACVEMEEIIRILQAKMSANTLFSPV